MFVTNPTTIPNFFPAAQLAEMEQVKVLVLVPENPKREGSKAWHRFNILLDIHRAGGTVADYIARGGRYASLSWNVERGLVQLVPLTKMTPAGALI